MIPAKDITRLLEIMVALRDPDTGCSWDIEQDFKSIISYTIEEVYEVADAIERGDRIDLCDELGDLLLQVVYHARIAEEEGSFDFSDVVQAITTKMIRRHPHVFGNTEQRQKGLVKGEWDRIKSEEKIERLKRRNETGLPNDTLKGHLAKVKTTQPVVSEAIALQNRAAEVGFDWTELQSIFDKMEEELIELKDAITAQSKAYIEAEFGDLYFTLLNLARRLNVDPQKALSQTNKKFRDRFQYIENSLNNESRTLQETSLEEMEKLWNAAKNK